MNYLHPSFPQARHRRLRYLPAMRELVAETQVHASDFMRPLFVIPGRRTTSMISSMPGIYRQTPDEQLRTCEDFLKIGIKSVLLFGLPSEKDQTGEIACCDHGIVHETVRLLKKNLPEMLVAVDVCNCEYTEHGHCGTIVDGDVDNDLTLATLGRQALSLAQAGADLIAPSDMMDGRIGFIRNQLDTNGFYKIPIMSYSSKFASGFYGPFREAANSAPQFGDRRSYQMDCRNGREAIRETASDIMEGADIVMVKPALSYMDVMFQIKQEFGLPLAAYNVSGEYAMVKAAAQNGWIDGRRVMMEMLTSFKRAGADIIITYFAEEAARLMLNGYQY